MTEQEINHAIATQINGWIHDEGIFYHDVNGFTCYLADYCNSIAHALDLAKALGIGLKPVEAGWSAYQVADPTNYSVESVAAKAICMCLLLVKQIQS
ncbi:MAG: hypothetical protein RLZZ574_2653 [Cyanobacteriota bacterium]|jgi:hypothetical protein